MTGMEISDRKKYLKRGRLVTWCDSCGDFIDIPLDGYDGRCPRCGELTIRRKCIRCESYWWPNDPLRFATACPVCKSPYYNRRRSINYTGERARPRKSKPRKAGQERTDAGTIPGLEDRT